MEDNDRITKEDLRDFFTEAFTTLILPKLNQIDQKLAEHDWKFAEHDRKFQEVFQRFDRVDARFDQLEGKYYAIVLPKLDEIDQKLSEHDEKFRDILRHFDAIYGWFERLENEYHVITESLRRIEQKLDGEIQKREVLERSIEWLKQQIADLQGRVERLEIQIRQLPPESS